MFSEVNYGSHNQFIIKLYILSKNIEKSIYNYTIDIAKEKNITRLWTNNVFLNLYINFRNWSKHLNKLIHILNKQNKSYWW